MLCTECGALIPDDHRYCGLCGAVAEPPDPVSLGRRLERLEQLVQEQTQVRAADQRYVDVETSEQIVTRLMKWAKLLAFFIGIPTAVIIIGVALYAGKGFKDLHDVAATARNTIAPVLEQARIDAEHAKSTALDASRTSAEVASAIRAAKASVSDLQRDLAAKSNEVNQLGTSISRAQSQIASLNSKVTEGNDQIAHLTQQVQAATTAKTVATIREAYPVFGQQIAAWREGSIDPAQKRPNEIYVSLDLRLPPQSPPALKDEALAKALSLLNENRFRVFLGGVFLNATSGQASQNVYAISNCGLAKISGYPCVMYFRQGLAEKISRLKSLLSIVQNIPDDHIRFVSPTSLPPVAQELLQKSALDVLVILGGQ